MMVAEPHHERTAHAAKAMHTSVYYVVVGPSALLLLVLIHCCLAASHSSLQLGNPGVGLLQLVFVVVHHTLVEHGQAAAINKALQTNLVSTLHTIT